MSRRTSGMTPEEYNRSLGLSPAGRNPHHASGGAFRAAPISVSTFLFVIYVIMGGNPSFVLLTNSSPIIEHESANTTDPSKAALEALLAKRLVRPGTLLNPTDIFSIKIFPDLPNITFVRINQEALAPQGHSLFGSKVYSLVDSQTGKSQGGKDSFFGLENYSKLRDALRPVLTISIPPPIASLARGGGGGGAVAFGGGGAAVAASHHHGGKKPHSSPTCGHGLCNRLHDEGAGHGGIVIPIFKYHCKDGSKKTVMIMGFEKGSWNFFCEKMEDKDNWCWIETIVRALLEEGKIFLSRHLEEADIKLGKPIGRTPVFYVELVRSMVTHDLSRRVLNAQVASDNSNRSLPHCFKEIEAIGFIELIGGNLVHLPGNPSGYPNRFSKIVKLCFSSLSS